MRGLAATFLASISPVTMNILSTTLHYCGMVRKKCGDKMGVSIDLSIDQLAEVLKQLGPDELADLEILLDKSELEKRSEEVKSGDYVTMEELESLRDV